MKARLLQPENSPKVLALIGQGGIGKTSSAVKLLEGLGVNLSILSLTTDSPYDCVMYFKVQEGTSFDDVAEFVLVVKEDTSNRVFLLSPRECNN